MFLDILEFRVENKKKTMEKCFENVVSNLWKMAYVSTKLILEKSTRKEEDKNMKTSTIFAGFWRQN